jgi:hypothetical protein
MTAPFGPGPFDPADDTIHTLIKDDLRSALQVTLGETMQEGHSPETLLEKDLFSQWQQHLLDLEYVNEEDATADFCTQRVIEAIRSFCRDDPTLADPDPGSPSYKNNLEAQPQWPGPLELDRLTTLTSFDGDKIHMPMPSEDDLSLFSRVLHFRLKTLGLYQGPVAEKLNEDTEIALDLFRMITGSQDPGCDILDSLGDARLLMDSYIKENNPLLVLKLTETQGEPEFDYEELAIINGRFVHGRDEWKVLEIHDAEHFKKARIKAASRPSVESRRMDIRNHFGLQLIQLRLWMHGFYKGRMDGWWGRMTFTALKEALAFEDLRQEEAVLYLGRGYWALNLEFLERRLFARLERSPSSFSGCCEVVREYSVYVKERNADHAALFTSVWDEVGKGSQGIILLGRRIYYGTKTLLRSGANALLKGFNWISGAIEKLAAPVLNFLHSFFRLAREGVQTAVQALERASHLALGKPIISRRGDDWALTRFDSDCDALLWVSEKSPFDLVRSHSQLCRAMARDLDFFLTVAGKVFSYMIRIAEGPPGWFRMALDLGMMVRDALKTRTETLDFQS